MIERWGAVLNGDAAKILTDEKYAARLEAAVRKR
jgi:hypothetical protein